MEQQHGRSLRYHAIEWQTLRQVAPSEGRRGFEADASGSNTPYAVVLQGVTSSGKRTPCKAASNGFRHGDSTLLRRNHILRTSPSSDPILGDLEQVLAAGVELSPEIFGCGAVRYCL